jgi:2-polyprenyl-6-hydroxyphenyl methylase/3-demethylubiquinone-9 3-methyltransferase
MSISTTNFAEVNKFNKESWWDASSEDFKMLHRFNPIRLEVVLEAVQGKNVVSVLDIGCGGGILCEPLARLGLEVTGLDTGENNIKKAREHALVNNLKINYVCQTIEGFAKDIQYDLVICSEVLEHVDNLDIFVKNMCQCVKQNGIVVISTINRTLKSVLFAKIMAEYVLKIVPKKTHDVKKFIKPSEIKNLMQQNDVFLEKFYGVRYNPFACSFSLHREDLDVNYIGVFVRG